MRSVRGLVMVGALVALLSTSVTAFAAGPRVRVIHASPDAPAVDVWVDGSKAFSNAAFKAATAYAPLAAGEHKVQVVPAGQTEPAVIDATLTLADGKDYSVAAVGMLAEIEPLVLEDNNSAPAEGKAHIRFVHTSPDAPAVDIAVKDGPVIFSNIPFKGVGTYTPVDAGTYDLEVRLAGTNTVALAVPGVKLDAGKVYTAWAMGLAAGEPALSAVLTMDADHSMHQGAPATLPTTGGSPNWLLIAAALLGGAALVTGASVRVAQQRQQNR
jgi:hypothetical protein